MMETQRNKKKSHRSTDGTPRSDGPTTDDGEEQTSLPSTTSADEGTTPDGVKKGKASSRQLQLKLGSKIKIATWNVRSMSAGKLQNVIAEAEKNNINILGIAEHRWGGQGHFSTIEGGKMIYLGKEKSGLSGVDTYLRGKLTNALMGYNPISDRILRLRLKGTAQNISLCPHFCVTGGRKRELLQHFTDRNR